MASNSHSRAARAERKARTKAAVSDIPLAEWLVSGLGLLLVLATAGYMGYAAMTKKDSPPDIQVELLSIRPQRQGFLAAFRAVNHGDQAAHEVHIIGKMGEGDAAELSDATLDFLPARSEKEGGLIFTRLPLKEALSLRASGYQAP